MIKVWGSVLLAAGALLLASPSFAQEACSASPDLNGDGTGLGLAHPTDGKGADWLTLWGNYANATSEVRQAEFLQ